MGTYNNFYKINSVDLIDVFYPVGTIYQTKDSAFNPNISWGGTWSKIEDKFLVASGEIYTDVGGSASASVTLTTDNLPSHNHEFIPSGSVEVTVNPTVSVSGGNHRHACYGYKNTGGTGTTFGRSGGNDGTVYTEYSGNLSFSGSVSGGSYSFTGTSGNTDSAGSGVAFSVPTIPPYQAVFIWERIA